MPAIGETPPPRDVLINCFRFAPGPERCGSLQSGKNFEGRVLLLACTARRHLNAEILLSRGLPQTRGIPLSFAS